MKITIRKNQNSLASTVFCAYLINSFYFKSFVSIHRLLTWGSVLAYIALNIDIVRDLLGKSKNYLNKLSILLIIWLALIFVSPVIHDTGDYTYTEKIVTMIGTALNMTVVLIIAYKNKGTRGCAESFMNIYMYSMVLYVMFSILCILVPSIKTVVVNLIDISVENMRLINIRKYATRIGWAGFSGYSCSLKCTIANVFALHFIMDNYLDKKKQRASNYFFYIITLVGISFYSRTGLIAALIILFLTFTYNLKRRNLFSALLLVIMFVVIVAVVPILGTLTLTNKSLAWLLEPLINFVSGDGLTSTTTAHIFNDMLFAPNVKQLMFGDGMYTGSNGYYMKTDLGFMRLILYFGIPGLLVTYYIVLFSISNVKKKLGCLANKHFALCWLVLFAIFEFKGESIQIIIPLLMLLCISIMADCSNNSTKTL